MASADEKLSYGFSTSFLNKNKTIKSLVNKAIKATWTQQRFLDELKKTSWWKGRSDAVKRYEVMKVENPGELRKQVSDAWTAVRNMSVRLGIALSTSQVRSIATAWVRNDLDDAQIRDMIGQRYSYRTSGDATRRGEVGIIGAARMQLDEMFRQYGQVVDKRTVAAWAREVARGRREVSDYESYARAQAARRFKAVATDINEGATIAEIIQPYVQVASEELGIPTSIFDISGKWTKPISGDHQYTMDEWIKTIRSDKSYGYDQSQNGQRQASVLATQLMQRMGAM